MRIHSEGINQPHHDVVYGNSASKMRETRRLVIVPVVVVNIRLMQQCTSHFRARYKDFVSLNRLWIFEDLDNQVLGGRDLDGQTGLAFFRK